MGHFVLQGMLKSNMVETTFFSSIRTESTFSFTLIITCKPINARTKLHFYLASFFHSSFVTMVKKKKEQKWWRIISNFQWMHHQKYPCVYACDKTYGTLCKSMCVGQFIPMSTQTLWCFLVLLFVKKKKRCSKQLKNYLDHTPIT